MAAHSESAAILYGSKPTLPASKSRQEDPVFTWGINQDKITRQYEWVIYYPDGRISSTSNVLFGTQSLAAYALAKEIKYSGLSIADWPPENHLNSL